jgi:predicted DNA-binding transcriptional regulator AlpA
LGLETLARPPPVSDLFDDPFLGTNELAAFIGRHPMSIYRYLRTNPDFPLPIRIGCRLAWRLSEVRAYIESRPRRQRKEINDA